MVALKQTMSNAYLKNPNFHRTLKYNVCKKQQRKEWLCNEETKPKSIIVIKQNRTATTH